MAGGKKEVCGVCLSNFTRNQSAVQCDVCNLWFHATCENIAEDEIKAMGALKNVSFICSSCKKSPPGLALGPLRDDIASLNTKLDGFINKSNDDSATFKKMFSDFVAELKLEINSRIGDVKADVARCTNHINQIESATTAKIAQLEIANNALHRKFNRCDIIVRGLPLGLTDLPAIVVELGSFFTVPINRSDVNLAYYLRNNNFVLIKFNNASMRDQIMKSYFQTVRSRSLMVSNLVKTEPKIEKRIFLNDHFSPSSTKLNAVCRKLLNDKVISKFRVLDADTPKAKVKMLNGDELVLDAIGCAALLSKNVAA